MTKNIRLSALFFAIGFLLFLVPAAFAQNNPTIEPHSGVDITRLYFQWLKMGPNGIPELENAIKNDNWRMRTHGLLAMGKTGDQTLTPLVLDRLSNDTNQAVKNCAVIALGDLKTTSAVPLLIDLLNQTQTKPPPKLLPQQRVIVQSLGKIGDSRSITPLFNLMIATKNDQMRGEVADALININNPKISRLILSHEKDTVRFPYVQAAQICGILPVEGSEAFLISLLKKNPLTVKNAAVISLGKIRSEKSTPKLLSLFETGNRLLQKNISDALVLIDTSSATLPLCDLMNSQDTETAMTAAIVLSRMTDKTIEPAVYERFKANPQTNAPAAVVLGRKKYKKAIPLLQDRLQNPKQSGQDEMAEALGLMAHKASIHLLMEVVVRKNKQGANGALWSLGHMKAKQAIPIMLKILKKQDRQLTASAVFALSEIGDPSTVKPLINLYYESGLQYQMQVALALSQIGGPEVAEILKTNMESDNPKRQKMAGYMLLKSRDPSLVPYAITLLAHPDETIRRYSLGGLKNITGQDFDTVDQWQEWGQE